MSEIKSPNRVTEESDGYQSVGVTSRGTVDTYAPIIKNPDSELSEISINSLGIIEESWNSILKIPGRIIEVTETTVVLECVIDLEKKTIQERTFKKDLFNGAVPLQEYQLVLIKIFQRTGKISYEFLNGNGLVKKSTFPDENFFEHLKGSAIDKPMR